MPLASGSCAGATSKDPAFGGELDSNRAFAVRLPGTAASVYALCLAHGPFDTQGPTDAQFQFHAH
eukprot:390231-Prymnesium_polylepis.1